jgi:hypothetical protein
MSTRRRQHACVAGKARSVFGNSKPSQLECKNSDRPDVCYSSFYSMSKTI